MSAPTAAQSRQIAKLLADAQTVFRKQVEAIAVQARAAILPYFQEHGLTYICGHGTWYIERPDGTRVDDEDLPGSIRKILYQEVEYNNLLGFWIFDIARTP